MKQFTKIAAVLAALVLASAFVACSDGNDRGSRNSVICTWVQSNNASNYYVFYADKTVEVWIDNTLTYSKNTVTYTGNPIADGSTVAIKTVSGVTLFTFTVSGSTATETTYKTRYNIDTSANDDDYDESIDVDEQPTVGGGNGEPVPNDDYYYNESNMMCVWRQIDNPSNGYIFYDNYTVVRYRNENLESLFYYSGEPANYGIVQIGMETFSIRTTGDTIIATNIASGTQYYVITPNDAWSEEEDSSANDAYVICTWRMSGDPSSFFVFYADKTVEAWVDGRLEYSKNTLYYTGDPIAEGSKGELIEIASGVTLCTFTVSGDVATVYISSFGVKYYIEKSSSSGGGVIESSGGSTNTDGDGGSYEDTPSVAPESPSTDKVSEKPITTDKSTLDEDYYFDMDNVICNWVQTDDESNGYIFYRNNTVVQIIDDDFYALFRYSGDPEYGYATIRGVGTFTGTTGYSTTIVTDNASGTLYYVMSVDEMLEQEEVIESGSSETAWKENTAW